MTSRPKFYLPVVLPPHKDQSDPPAYYAGISALSQVTADSPGDDGSLELTITNPAQLHPADQFDEPLPLSTVFAPTAGFARFYPGSAVLPTADQQPSEPPVGLSAADFGSVLIRVWVSNFVELIKPPEDEGPRANSILLGWLDPTSVETAFTAEIAKLKDSVLEKAWEDGGGTGNVPDRAGLEAAFLQRFMAGDAEVFVSAGAVVGSAVSTPSGEARMKLLAFAVRPDPEPALALEADDLIDNAHEAPLFADDLIDNVREARLFEDHPVAEAADAEAQLTLTNSTFLLWDNVQRAYVPFASKDVKLMKKRRRKDPGVEVNHEMTDADGKVASFTGTVARGDLIYFQYATMHETFGDRKFADDAETEPVRARKYLKNAADNEFKAHYSFYANYARFIDELSANALKEQFEEDRGNAAKRDDSKHSKFLHKPLPGDEQHQFLETVEDSEKQYRSDFAPAKMFTVLFEGDSWLNYPLAYDDIYGHLRNKLQQAMDASGAKLLLFPLQHYGDRSDQMFVNGGNRQWKYTTDLLSEFKVDLIVCSGGGNDLAEPGIGNSTDYKLAKKFFTDGYFDPRKAEADINDELTPHEQEIFQRQLKISFAALLKNHRWNLYLSGLPESAQWSEGALAAHLDAKLNDMAAELGEDPTSWLGGIGAVREEIGKRVIERVPGRVSIDSVTGAETPGKAALPHSGGNAHDRLLAEVFDTLRYKTRFDDVKTNWEIMLKKAAGLGIPVVTHTYCYPLFNDYPTSPLGEGINEQTGPWFNPRFDEANITSRRVRAICLKGIVDNFVGYILEPLKASYVNLHYADVREVNPLDSRWRDEMHLRDEGFAAVAEKIYAIIQTLDRFQEVTQ